MSFRRNLQGSLRNRTRSLPDRNSDFSPRTICCLSWISFCLFGTKNSLPWKRMMRIQVRENDWELNQVEVSLPRTPCYLIATVDGIIWFEFFGALPVFFIRRRARSKGIFILSNFKNPTAKVDSKKCVQSYRGFVGWTEKLNLRIHRWWPGTCLDRTPGSAVRMVPSSWLMINNN